MKIKRVLLTTALALSISTNNLFALAVSANSISPESKEYVHDGYTVTYYATQNTEYSSTVEVTIQNTGENTIKGWAVEYMSVDAIDNIWDAGVYCITDNGYPIINCTTHNSDIKPNESVSFGYAIDTNTFVPEDIKLSQLRMEKEHGFDVDFYVENEWDTGFNGIIEISNTTDTPIIDWQLAFGSNFSIINSDTFEISTHSTDYYVIEGTYNNYIDPNSSILLNFVGEKNTEEANLQIDYLSEIIPYYDTNNANIDTYYSILNYSNEGFPLNFDITVDETSLDFDMYNMQIMGIPYWNTTSLRFDITPYLNECFSDFCDFKLTINNAESEVIYTSGDIITGLSLDVLYDYTVELLYENEYYITNVGNFIVSTDIYNSLYIINDYSEVNSTGVSLMSYYSCIYDNDYANTGSSSYNNESMSTALNMPINFSYTTSAIGDGIIRNSADGDYYAITVPKNSTTKIALTVPDDEHYNLYVYNSSKKLVLQKTAKGNKYISFNNGSSVQTYYVLVCGNGLLENGKSSYFSTSLPYTLNITNAKDNRIWFGQREYKVGKYEYWDGNLAEKLYFDNTSIVERVSGNKYTYKSNVPFFIAGSWENVKSKYDIMEEGCVASCIAMSLRNLGKTMEGYDFRLGYEGKLPADPFTVIMANNGIDGTKITYSSTDKKYHYKDYIEEPAYARYGAIGSAFDSTIKWTDVTGFSEKSKAEQIMKELNNGSSTQGVVVYSDGHALLLFKSNTPNSTNYSERFVVYDPISSNYGVNYSTYTKFTLKNITFYVTVK